MGPAAGKLLNYRSARRKTRRRRVMKFLFVGAICFQGRGSINYVINLIAPYQLAGLSSSRYNDLTIIASFSGGVFFYT